MRAHGPPTGEGTEKELKDSGSGSVCDSFSLFEEEIFPVPFILNNDCKMCCKTDYLMTFKSFRHI